jgi:hypothetical protein
MYRHITRIRTISALTAANLLLFTVIFSADIKNSLGIYSEYSLKKFEDFEKSIGRKLNYICENFGSHFWPENTGTSRYEGISNAWSFLEETTTQYFATPDGRNLSHRTDLTLTATFPLAFNYPGDTDINSDLRRTRLQEVADGVHDEFYQGIAERCVAGGHGHAIFRLGHEFNGWNYMWLAEEGNADVYKAAFRHVVLVMRPYSPDFRFDYNMDRGGYDISEELSGDNLKVLAYPGDEYVDIVGADVYDTRPWEIVQSWLDTAHNFAVLHNKPFSIPEWGIWSNGDNPEYIENMHNWMARLPDTGAGRLVYHNYFNTSYHRLDDNPDAKAKFWEIQYGPVSTGTREQFNGERSYRFNAMDGGRSNVWVSLLDLLGRVRGKTHAIDTARPVFQQANGNILFLVQDGKNPTGKAVTAK